MITYVTGDATYPVGDGPKAILHICNNRGGWGAGFTGALTKRWPDPELLYRHWFFRERQSFVLGAVQRVDIRAEPGLTVVNMIAQDGYATRANPTALDYAALDVCLHEYVRTRPDGESVHMPRIGSGLAGGDWDQVAFLISEVLWMIPVTIYDLPREQRDG